MSCQKDPCKKCFCAILRCMLECLCEEPPPEDCETAYAKSDDLSTCFIDLGFGNWGWTNGPIEEGYDAVWPVWAGAGQCDTDNGRVVGELHVIYQNGDVMITFNADPECCITEQQVYVGTDTLPTGPNGQPTTAPGQYPYKEEFDECMSSSTLVVPAEGPVCVIFHAVACCEGE